jgi:hypothetical protein
MATTYKGGEVHHDALILAKVIAENNRAALFVTKERSMRINDLFKLRETHVFIETEFTQ